MLRFKNDQTYLTFDDVALVPKYNPVSSRSEVNLTTTNNLGSFALPLVSSPMDQVSGPEFHRALWNRNVLGIRHRFQTLPDFDKQDAPVAVAVGVDKDFISKVCSFADIICIDIAHGHSNHTKDIISFIREQPRGKQIKIIAGSVATAEGTKFCIESGADAIRVGVSSGSICVTRLITGFGVPQLSALSECVDEADRLGRGTTVISDGGHRTTGDVVKSLAAGADMVMLGSMFAGADETPGDVQVVNGVPHKLYRGMASKDINKLLNKENAAEGVSTLVKTKGSVNKILDEIAWGLKSAFTYAGARNLKEFQNNVEFIRISTSGYIEGTPHILNGKQ